ncbi:hypothetical protein K493DRAFT_318325 [Basidiobolus meristosporus CBS 931.73]|uniref:Uncharacterized protein n=1 Tax=Basidiobolus meristosporus CBS 931.73 TaxID=1314790 RepID=A0A1Y1XW61_9FUNG|nr:hypothetical protein K493DRAFT_318325 [Basidiobolus meristosporus CBS 931.73]|eukprot:ORX89925.1 hypothetical protein K493DRAFT_318325 [Basidiobolus meristosporus CBS 931.73]
MYTPSTESSPYNAVPDSERDLGFDSIEYPDSDCLAQSPPYVPPSPGPLPPLFSIPSPCCYEDISAEYSPPYVPDPIYPVDQSESALRAASPYSDSSIEWVGDVPKSPLGPYSYHEVEPIYVKECVFFLDEDIYDGWSIDPSQCTFDYSESLYKKLVDQYEEPRKRFKHSPESTPTLDGIDPKSQSGTVGQEATTKKNPVGHQLLRKSERRFIEENGLFDTHSPSDYLKHKKNTVY